jgi:TatD DNase family protein
VLNEYFPDERQIIYDRAFACHVQAMINPAVTVQGLPEIIEIIDNLPQIYGAAGQHPHDAKDWCAAHRETVIKTLEHPKMVAVGECGLDYFYNNSSREEQLLAFREQIAIAVSLDKPIIVHCRDAWNDAFELLGAAGTNSKGARLRGVFHCFTGGPEHLDAIRELDFYVSFSGILTYSSAKSIQAAAPLMAENRILVETDCPFLAPQKVRGKRNEPSFVWWTAQKLAELRNTPLEALAPVLSANARDLFRLPG